MKKVLVISPTYYPSYDANTICMTRILEKSRDIEYTVLAEKSDDSLKQEEKYNGIRIIRYDKKSIRRDIKEGNYPSIARNLNAYIRAKYRSKYYKYDINFDRITNFLLEYKKHVDLKQYDVLLSFANPIESHYIAYKLSEKYRLPWIASYFDPFFSNKTKTSEGYKKRKALEEKILKQAAYVVMPRFIERDYKKKRFSFDANEPIECEIPGIREIKRDTCDEKKLIESDGIKCIFVGNLYWKIRNPKSLIEAFRNIGDEISLYFVGGCFDGNIEELLEKDGMTIPSNVHFLGRVPPKLAEKYLNEADVLVNIGNTTDNQLPSKVLDYISIGKPILNIRKITEDPSNEFFERYPLALTINETEIITGTNKDIIRKFCNENKGKQLSFDIIERLMHEASVQYVRNKYREILYLCYKG